MKKIIPILTSVSMFFTVGVVMGATQDSGSMSSSSGAQSFDRLDQNRDGFINWSESSDGKLFGVEKDFNIADTNRDGKLNRSEYDSYVKSHGSSDNGMGTGTNGSRTQGGTTD